MLYYVYLPHKRNAPCRQWRRSIVHFQMEQCGINLQTWRELCHFRYGKGIINDLLTFNSNNLQKKQLINAHNVLPRRNYENIHHYVNK